jgi:hypothetical protein
MPWKKAAAMKMAANTAKSVAAKAEKSKKKKERSRTSSDEDELERAPKKPNRAAAAAEDEATGSSEEDASSYSDDEEKPQLSQKPNKLSQEDDTVEDELKTKTKYADEDEEMSTDVGPWDFMLNDGHKGNATQVQRSIVPWCIAIYGLNYHKNVTLDAIKEMVLALCAMNGWVSCPESAKRYNVAFNDVANRVKAAAGMFCYILSLKNRMN